MQEKVRNVFLIAVSFLLMGLTGIVALFIRIVSFGTGTNFVSRHIVAPSSRLILRFCGYKYKFPKITEFPKGQVMYTFNHNSFLDIFVLTAMGIPNTRFFLSENTIKYIPVTLSALAIGIYYIPVKKNVKRRNAFFSRMEKKLNNNDQSIFVSSEGVHQFTHGINRFNDGVYFLATACKLPIYPVFIQIPREDNPFESFRVLSGSIEISLLDRIDTTNWKLENLQINKNMVREVFIKEFNKRND